MLKIKTIHDISRLSFDVEIRTFLEQWKNVLTEYPTHKKIYLKNNRNYQLTFESYPNHHGHDILDNAKRNNHYIMEMINR